MKMRNYLKKDNMQAKPEELFEEAAERSVGIKTVRKRMLTAAVILTAGVLTAGILSLRCFNSITLSDEGMVQLSPAPIAAASGKKGVITIPAGVVKANPFLPYRDISGTASESVSDVPAYSLVEPPEVLSEDSDAARVMDTIVTGILYDKYSPSAILNIEGSDYLVKKGDVVNNYKILNILQDSVTVKLGNNTYKAGIGEILTEGTLNHNDVSNLSNKFGGERL